MFLRNPGLRPGSPADPAMIRGIGVDIADIGRFRTAADIRGLLDQVLTPREIERVTRNGIDPGKAALLFSAKEALVKALGCGTTDGWRWHDIEISADLRVELTGHLKALAADRSVSAINVSLSSFKDHAVALVLLNG